MTEKDLTITMIFIRFFLVLPGIFLLFISYLENNSSINQQKYIDKLSFWPQITATVTEDIFNSSFGPRVGGERPASGPRVYYRYIIDEHVYIGTDKAWFFIQDKNASKKVIEKLNIKKGDRITIRYNPENLKESIYKIKFHQYKSQSMKLLIWGILLLILSIIMNNKIIIFLKSMIKLYC